MRRRTFVSVIVLVVVVGCRNQQLTNSTSNDLFERRKTCMEIGWRAFDRFKADVPSDAGAIEPTFHYNTELSTCLMAGGYLGAGQIEYYFVRDLLANRELVNFRKEGATVFGVTSLGEFVVEQRRLLQGGQSR